jgi:hypothetical protein
MKLSIIVPGIRPHNWERLYQSTSMEDFEMIFIGPEPDNTACHHSNVKFIKDYGNPVRAMNIGLENAEGEYVHWEADDACFLDEEPLRSFNEAEILYKKNDKAILSSIYLEGDGNEMLKKDRYEIYKAIDCSNLFIQPSFLILNTGFVRRDIIEQFGGWDSQNFSTLFFAHTDLAIRLQSSGYILSLSTGAVARCEHMPHITGDHAPIHYAHIQEDEPRFRRLYSASSVIDRKLIDLHNWIHVPAVWKNRFRDVNLKSSYRQCEKYNKSIYECLYEV